MYLSGVIADNQEYKIINNQLQELSDDLKSDTLNLESLETLMERVSEIMKNKELLKLHKTVTIADIFPKYIEQRKKNVVATTWTKELVYYDKLLKILYNIYRRIFSK